MIRKVQFESQERRINQVLAALKENGINSSSASRMPSGHTYAVLLSPSRRV